MSKNDGGPAFPATWWDRDSTGEVAPRASFSGMTLRQHYAASALARVNGDSAEQVAQRCFEIADAMLAHEQQEQSDG